MSLPSQEGSREDRENAKRLNGGVLSGEAKKALALYGTHLDWCAAIMGFRGDDLCDCGLDALKSP